MNYLQLETGQDITIFVPKGNNGGYTVPFSFFDKLNDYEFSQTIAELLAFNPNFDLRAAIRERDERRKNLGLQATNYNPLLESKFGDWIARTGKKIEQFFKPTEKTTPVTVTTPDGQEVTVQAPIKQESGAMKVLGYIASAFGFQKPGQQQQQQVQPTLTQQVMPLLLLAGAGFIIYKIVKK